MLNVILNGCNGKMGRVITECIGSRESMEIVAGVDIKPVMESYFPVFTNIFDFNGKADVIIDFSHPAALEKVLEYAKATHTPAIIATTGLSPAQLEDIKEASKEVALFFSFNMSLGINLLVSLAKKAAAILSEDYDIEVIESHHNQKIDAPSGTALMLTNAICDTLSEPYKFVYDRHSQRKKRNKREIGIHSVRGGTIVGEHEIIFAGQDEIIKLSHAAHSKNIFAVGSINAAVFLAGKPAGLYDMSDLVSGT